jgi:hypothetical protein
LPPSQPHLLIVIRNVAIAAVYFAAKGTGTEILDGRIGAPWWEQLGGMIVKAVGVMNEFYTENPPKRQSLREITGFIWERRGSGWDVKKPRRAEQ